MIFTILLKHVDKRAIQGIIHFLKGVLLALMMSFFSDRFFKRLSELLVLICAALVVIMLSLRKLHRINQKLMAVLDQSERLVCDHDD